MATIEQLVPIILKCEGGESNHPSDKGGLTYKGITYTTYVYYRKMKGLPKPSANDLKHISNQEWMDVLRVLYWNRWKADSIGNQSIANLLVDWVWTSGDLGVKYPQQVLGVVADGFVGLQTLTAVNEYTNQADLFNKLWIRRKQHFESIVERDSSQTVFLKGWINRLNDFKFEE